MISLAGSQTPLAGPLTPLAGPQTSLIDPQTPPASPQTPPTSPQTPCMEGRLMDGWTYGWTDGIFPHYTGLRPLLGPLPCHPLRFHNIQEAGQGNR